MQTTGRISVAMATFNGAKYLQAQLDSLAGQITPPFELVVSDDASSDRTTRIIQDFALTASFPVRLIVQEQRRGVADNFLAAATACSGELIAFCDQDDVWLPQKLKAAEAEMARTDCIVFVHQSRVVDQNLTGDTLLDQRIGKVGLLRALSWDAYDLGYGHCMVFHRSLLSVGELAGRPMQPRGSGRMAHDHWIMQLGSLLGPTLISNRVLTLYRQHADNAFGAALLPPSSLADYATPALQDYAARRDLNAALAGLLTDRALSGLTSVRGDRAKGARVRSKLRARAQRLDERIRAYSSDSLLVRAAGLLGSVTAGLKSGSVSARELALSCAKDALFGVAQVKLPS